LWRHFYSEIEQYSTTAPRDGSLTLVEEEPLLEKLFKEIGKSDHAYPEEKYLLLARFFEQVSDFQKAAYFYQFAEGKVPKKVFKSLANQGRGNCYKKEVHGVQVKRHISSLEKLKIKIVEIGKLLRIKIVKIGKLPVPAYLFMLFLILAFMLGMLGEFFLQRVLSIDTFAPDKSELEEPSDGSNSTTDVPSGK
jgi:hypothetical protein